MTVTIEDLAIFVNLLQRLISGELMSVREIVAILAREVN